MTAAWLYGLLLLLGTIEFVRRGWRISIWWIAFYSTAIYSVPLVIGRDLFGVALSAETWITMLIVMATTLAIEILSKPLPPNHVEELPIARYFVMAAVIISLASFCMLIAVHGTEIFYTHKTESGIGGYFYILWRLSASYALLSCLMVQNYRLALLASLPLVASLFAGDRTAVALTVIASLWMWFQTMRLSGLRLGVVLACVVVLGLFLFFGKTFQAEWATGTFISLADLVRTIVSSGTKAVIHTEPFGTIGVFNALTKLDHGPSYPLVLEVAAQLLILPSYFGFESGSFNDFFQPILFPGSRAHSLAYSYWGEAYVRGSWFGVAAFLFVYLAVMHFFQRLTRGKSFPVRAFAYLGGSYWAFYIHRNSMVSIIAYERQIVLFVLVIVVCAYALKLINRRVNS